MAAVFLRVLKRVLECFDSKMFKKQLKVHVLQVKFMERQTDRQREREREPAWEKKMGMGSEFGFQLCSTPVLTSTSWSSADVFGPLRSTLAYLVRGRYSLKKKKKKKIEREREQI